MEPQAGLRTHVVAFAKTNRLPMNESQWLIDLFFNIYRCGGSVGVVAISDAPTSLLTLTSCQST